MPINASKQIAFVHIPRTGGTFVEHGIGVHDHRPESGFGTNYNHSADLEHLFGRNLQHLGFADMVVLLGRSAMEYQWFTVVRNPADRLRSVIGHTLKRPDALSSLIPLLKTVGRIVKIRIRTQRKRCGLYLGACTGYRQIRLLSPVEQHLARQSDYVYVPRKLETRLDFFPFIEVFPFEALNDLPTHIHGFDAPSDKKIPNQGKSRIHPKRINVSFIKLLSKLLYHRDWALHRKSLVRWNESKAPMLIPAAPRASRELYKTFNETEGKNGGVQRGNETNRF